MNALRILRKFLVMTGFTLIAGLCALISYINYKEVYEIKTWVPTIAIVVSSTQERQVQSKGVTYCPIINVKYDLNGQQQVSQLEIKNGPCSPISNSITKLIDQYKVGSTVNAYVNPSKPSQIRVATYSLGVWFYLFIFISILCLYVVVDIWRRPANLAVNTDAAR